ncbi:DNA replication/repair protein RecF [Phaeobacter sp. QD34_3]|uniref:DNA replication/repair protein RecF n=1 Tax=unclassified Phaeobacter TaxID=2621772 RepID=UPI00237FD256|nr:MULTISPECIES: DNA replication/repair protein RecF [unclassified Phaeobacter]MDE4133214.1 DNA replication/repair protein RecF [Phaeobacter sp. QD34_3]MDE4136716.1 DNA replication/repair protein RecF [Phaeobacter sp. QD34_24]MDE4173023.1 DNA replication/repair protein RecF [Phaeobacter sp. PT47_59]
MLALTELTMSHFRSHLRAELHLDGRPVALFGPNGAGKTNILEAVSLFSPGRGLRRASAAEMTRRPEALGWKLKAVLRAPDQAYEVETWSEGGNARQVRIDNKASNQIVLGQICRVVWLIPAMDRLWIEAAEGRRRFLDRIVLSFDPGHAEATLSYEKAMRERNRLLKDQNRDPAWYKVLERQMAEAGHRINAARIAAVGLLQEAQGQAETAFPVAELELIQSEGSMPDTEDDLREALAESRFRDLAAGRTLVGPHRTDLIGTYAAKGVPARDCSTGEQKALLVSLILANARALSAREGAPPIVLLDEVAAHLDAARRAALYDEICALGAQAWMTGTEAELFAEMDARAQMFEITDTGDGSVIESRS